jgi:ribosomal protein L12E/L44/L45/RPP1/RPP2
MKLSSRNKLLKEADRELNSIRLKNLLESNGEMDTERIEKVAQKIADKKTEKIQSKIERDLELFKAKSVSMQRDFEKAHEETGISIEEWYKSQPDRNKAIYGLESYYRRPITDNLWDRVMIAIDSMFPNSIAIDSDGNEYNRNTGERIEKPTGLDSNTASIIRSVIQSLSI